jgi:hypothetical protein
MPPSPRASRFLRLAALLPLAALLGGCFDGKESSGSSVGNISGLENVRGTIERIAYATVGWDAPTERVDGTPIGPLSAFRIYYGTAPSSLDKIVTVTDAGSRSARVYSLTPGTWYFAVTAVDADGMESERSAVASKTIT